MRPVAKVLAVLAALVFVAFVVFHVWAYQQPETGDIPAPLLPNRDLPK